MIKLSTTKSSFEQESSLPASWECTACRSQTKRKLFRTGSVQHSGGEYQVCPSCGDKKSCDSCEEETGSR